MLGDVVLLLVTAFALMGSPGPATLSLAAIGRAFGARAGRGYLLGIVAGTSAVLAIVASGVSGMVLAVPFLDRVVTVLAGAYILHLAWRIASAPPLGARQAGARAPSLAEGFLLAIANPKAYAAIAAVYSSRLVVRDDLALDAAVKLALLTAVILVVNAAWLAFGSAFAAWLGSPRWSRPINIAFALMLVASVAVALIR